MQRKLDLALLAGAALTSACTIPETPLSSTITTPFRAQVQNASYPEVHNQYMNLFQAGGGDQHLFIGPVGVPTYDLVLTEGVIEHDGVRAVIGGEYSEIDSTTKMFMTSRGDYRAIFAPTYGCNPDTDELQVELSFVTWQNSPPGGWICVRPAFDDSHEFRYYPPGNDKVDPDRTCIKVTLVVLPNSGPSTTLSTSTISATGSSTVVVPVTSTTTSVPTSTGTPAAYADMTSNDFAFVGCAPEERWANDEPGRTLTGELYALDTMTNEKCVNYCGARGYLYAGTEYSRECWCGNSYLPTRQPGTTVASLAGCSMTCSGDPNQICGGDSWLSLYEACSSGSPCTNAVFT